MSEQMRSRAANRDADRKKTAASYTAQMFDVVAVLVSREFKGRYKNTSVGFVWSLISPLMYLLVFYFVFKLGLRIPIERYATFAFTGILAWMWMQACLTESTGSITTNAPLVNQPGFPVAALPVIACVTAMFNFLIAAPLLFVILLIEGGEIHITALLFPVVMVVQFTLALGLSYFLAALNVHFRDTRYALPIILQLGYYVTPIFYRLDTVPEDYRNILALNPMVYVVEAYRAVLMEGEAPHWFSLSILLIVSLVLLIAGYAIFRRASDRFLEEL